MIVCPGCDEKAILNRAEHVRASIEKEPVVTPEGNVLVSLSIGAVSVLGEAHQDKILKSVDDALYRAKCAGRNRVELARV